MSKVFLDTAPVIYLIESHPTYMPRVAGFIQDVIQADKQFITSPITFAEFGLKPYAAGRKDLMSAYLQFLEDFSIKSFPIDEIIAGQSIVLRSKYPSLKLADALQLSMAILSDCQQFLTNDKSLNQIKEIEVILIDNLPDPL